MSHTIIFATRNKAKQAEILKVAERFNMASKIRFPESEYPESAEPHDTFEGNARQKAKDAADYFVKEMNVLFVGDDSGMEIASLGGAPGVKTRRWGGKRLTDTEFDEYCLEQLKGKQDEDSNKEISGLLEPKISEIKSHKKNKSTAASLKVNFIFTKLLFINPLNNKSTKIEPKIWFGVIVRNRL